MLMQAADDIAFGHDAGDLLPAGIDDHQGADTVLGQGGHQPGDRLIRCDRDDRRAVGGS